MDLESVAAELSTVPPATFVARRAELAKAGREQAAAAATEAGASPAAAKAAGRELAEAIKKLSKPSAAAWAVNLLQTERPGQLDAIVELGANFRAAVAAGDAARLTALSTERRTTLRRVTAKAVELAEQALAAPVVPVGDDGSVPDAPTLSPAVSTDVEQTLQAVLADPAAAAAVRTGRLVRALVSNGVEAVDLADAVGGPFTPPEPDDEEPEDDAADEDAERSSSTRSGSSSSSSSGSGTRSDSDSSNSAATRAARDAAQALDDLDHQLDELRELRRRAREQSDVLADEISTLEARLADLTAELDDRRADREQLEDRLDETDRQFGRLDRERDRAARLAETTARAANR